MPVQHKDTCESGVNPIQCAYYNKDHKIVNMLGYELVETKNIVSPVSIVSFNDLLSIETDEFLLEGDLAVSVTGTNSVLHTRINGISTNYNSTFSRWWGTSGDVTFHDTTLASVKHGSSGQTLYQHFELNIQTNLFGLITSNGRGISKSPTETVNFVNGGSYNGGPVDISSFSVQHDQGTFTGEIRLWKRIPLDGGE